MHIDTYARHIVLPKSSSRKGQNGRVLVIGGSTLFHAAAFWSASMASKIVDMVHFSSPTLENNDLMRVRAKEKFWDGIVVPWEEVDHYIEEDDAILIGPGMERGEETKKIVDTLLAQYPDKKWVVDGGALQMVDPQLVAPTMIVTPNYKEYEIIRGKVSPKVVMLRKGETDQIIEGETVVEVTGGNPGMTKGGTGDVLAGLVTALYATSPAMASAVVGSYVNKRAGEAAAREYGPYYSANDLIPYAQRELKCVL